MNIPLFMKLFLALGVTFTTSIYSQGTPSIDSLNQQMNELERLLGAPSDITNDQPGNLPVEQVLVPISIPTANQQLSEMDLPESLQGIEKKLKQLESIVGELPEVDIVKEAKHDPWLSIDPNSTIPEAEMPRIEISSGMVVRYLPSDNSFLPVDDGEIVKTKTLFVIPSGSELVISFMGKSAVRFGANSRVVLGPAVDNKQLIDLRSGTVSAYLNPERDLSTSPQFGIRTRSGMIETKGIFYAVTEYNGQAYMSDKSAEAKTTLRSQSKLDMASTLDKSPSNQISKPEEN